MYISAAKMHILARKIYILVRKMEKITYTVNLF